MWTRHQEGLVAFNWGQFHINTLRPTQNGRHFPDDIFNCIFLNENIWILIKISLRFVSEDRINKIPALVQIMAWRRSGDKPLSEPMMVSSLTHICITRPQWVKGSVYLSLKWVWKLLIQDNSGISQRAKESIFYTDNLWRFPRTSFPPELAPLSLPPSSLRHTLRHSPGTKGTVRCHHNMVNFLQNPHNRHPIARP